MTRLTLRPFCSCVDCDLARRHLDVCRADACRHVEVEMVESGYFEGPSTPLRRFLANRRRVEDGALTAIAAVVLAVCLAFVVLPR